MLWVIAVLLVILIGVTREGPEELSRILSVVDRFERSQPGSLPEMGPSDNPEQGPTEEERQDHLRQLVERECGGWQRGRIVCRRATAEPLLCEYVLATTDRTYTAHGVWDLSNALGNSYAALQLDMEIRYAVSEAMAGNLGVLLAENPEGKILSLQLTEEKVNQK